YGGAPLGDEGLFHLERQVVLDESGAFVSPRPEDAPADLLQWTMTVSLDPQGHATFFSGVVHAPGNAVARRAYVWGYPPGTRQNIGSIGGPRSPAAPRKLPPRERQAQDTGLSFALFCDPEDRCRMEVLLKSPGEVAPATTEFRANLLGEDMRYYPSETAGGAVLLADGGVYHVDLHVVHGPRGGLRSARIDDPPERVETMTAAIALSSAGHVTFFYGFLREPGSDRVGRFLLWGYPPETLMVDEDEEGDADRNADPADPRRT
ncbi:hypothetical protein K8I85_18285, partial [bacterium]|nr:hypothetical protein [bacterium]